MDPVRTTTSARYVKDKATVQVPDVSSWSISNFSDSVLNVVISNVATPIEPYDPVAKVPGQFTRDGDGTLSDLDIRTEFANPAKSGNAIIYFNALKKDNCTP